MDAPKKPRKKARQQPRPAPEQVEASAQQEWASQQPEDQQPQDSEIAFGVLLFMAGVTLLQKRDGLTEAAAQREVMRRGIELVLLSPGGCLSCGGVEEVLGMMDPDGDKEAAQRTCPLIAYKLCRKCTSALEYGEEQGAEVMREIRAQVGLGLLPEVPLTAGVGSIKC